jgi:parallel beta-helix repeat protein
MDRWARFVDWCQRPSKIKVRSFNPRNVVVLTTISIILASSIIFAVWRYQVAGSVVQSLAITRDNYESLFPTLRITEDTTLTEAYTGHIIIAADDINLDGNGHTITGGGVWMWNSTQRMWDVARGISVKGRSGVTVKNCRVTNFGMGLTLDRSDGCTLQNNTVYENIWGGISVQFSTNNTVLGNTVYGTRDVDEPYDYTGFSVEMSFGNSFKGNVAYDNGRGFSIGEFEREVFEGERGFIPEEYEGNIFEANTAKTNTEAGFWIGGTMNPSLFNNIFFHNNLIDNPIQAFVSLEYGYSNSWDDGYPSGGNYWSDYEGVDADDDGIGDTPYDIPTVSYEWDEENPEGNPVLIVDEPDGKNVDRYPLMAPFGG